MQRLLWAAIIVGALGVGLAAGVGLRFNAADDLQPNRDLSAQVATLQRRLVDLQQQLAAKEKALASLQLGLRTAVPAPAVATARQTTSEPEQQAVETQPGELKVIAEQDEAEASEPADQATALAHFYQYLDETTGTGRRDRWRRARELADTLRDIGEPAVLALLDVLTEGVDTRERSTAARLLGALQDPQALPALQQVLEAEEDLLLRRAAARGLSRLQVPETIPVFETVLSNDGEDRFVRMSAAYGLAQLGEAQGVSGLEQIFTESTQDGRGHYLAFRALTSLGNAESVPLMRDVVTSEAEVMYRVGAIDFLATQGDKDAIPLLQQVAASADEQPSVREAAERALTTISQP